MRGGFGNRISILFVLIFCFIQGATWADEVVFSAADQRCSKAITKLIAQGASTCPPGSTEILNWGTGLQPNYSSSSVINVTDCQSKDPLGPIQIGQGACTGVSQNWFYVTAGALDKAIDEIERGRKPSGDDDDGLEDPEDPTTRRPGRGGTTAAGQDIDPITARLIDDGFEPQEDGSYLYEDPETGELKVAPNRDAALKVRNQLYAKQRERDTNEAAVATGAGGQYFCVPAPEGHFWQNTGMMLGSVANAIATIGLGVLAPMYQYKIAKGDQAIARAHLSTQEKLAAQNAELGWPTYMGAGYGSGSAFGAGGAGLYGMGMGGGGFGPYGSGGGAGGGGSGIVGYDEYGRPIYGPGGGGAVVGYDAYGNPIYGGGGPGAGGYVDVDTAGINQAVGGIVGGLGALSQGVGGLMNGGVRVSAGMGPGGMGGGGYPGGGYPRGGYPGAGGGVGVRGGMGGGPGGYPGGGYPGGAGGGYPAIPGGRVGVGAGLGGGGGYPGGGYPGGGYPGAGGGVGVRGGMGGGGMGPGYPGGGYPVAGGGAGLRGGAGLGGGYPGGYPGGAGGSGVVPLRPTGRVMVDGGLGGGAGGYPGGGYPGAGGGGVRGGMGGGGGYPGGGYPGGYPGGGAVPAVYVPSGGATMGVDGRMGVPRGQGGAMGWPGAVDIYGNPVGQVGSGGTLPPGYVMVGQDPYGRPIVANQSGGGGISGNGQIYTGPGGGPIYDAGWHGQPGTGATAGGQWMYVPTGAGGGGGALHSGAGATVIPAGYPGAYNTGGTYFQPGGSAGVNGNGMVAVPGLPTGASVNPNAAYLATGNAGFGGGGGLSAGGSAQAMQQAEIERRYKEKISQIQSTILSLQAQLYTYELAMQGSTTPQAAGGLNVSGGGGATLTGSAGLDVRGSAATSSSASGGAMIPGASGAAAGARNPNL